MRSETAGGSRTIAVAGGAAAVGTLPVFLVGSLAAFLREDIGFNQAELGLAVASFFVASSIAAYPGGQLTERVGARATILGSILLSLVASLGIALVTRSWIVLVVWLLLAGVANGVIQPAGNLALVQGVPSRHHGFAFGIKQASIPASTMLAGVAVPLIGLTIGWQYAFIGAAVCAALIGLAMPSNPYRSMPVTTPGRRRRIVDMSGGHLLALAVASGLSSATATSLASFYVGSAANGGVDLGLAGVLLAVGSASVIAVRLFIGWSVDRVSRNHLRIVATMLAVGTIGFFGLGYMGTTWVLVASTLLAFAAGWGWPGLFNYAIVSLNPSAPALATSVTQTGVFIGGFIGPALFGLVAERVAFRAAWAMAAGFTLLASLLIWWMSRILGNPHNDRLEVAHT